MDARLLRALVALAALGSLGASARTQHFLVTAPSQQLADQVARAAEQYRRDLAMDWLGRPLGPWADICPIRVIPNRLASGETSFVFPVGGGHPREWRMIVEGPPERILDSVLPHEILHTVFATHFKNPLPRWADEGACTTVEHRAERSKHDSMLIQFLTGDDGIPFNKMFQMREYPRNILPLYSQGYSVAQYLIAQGGKRKFVDYVGEGMRTNNWTAATRKYYAYQSLSELQVRWVSWVGSGSPPIRTREPAAVASSQPQVSPVSATAAAPTPTPTARPAVATAPPVRPRRPLAAAVSPAAFTSTPARPASPQAGGDGWYASTARNARSRTAPDRQPLPPLPAAPPAPTAPAAPDSSSFSRGQTLIQWSQAPSSTFRR